MSQQRGRRPTALPIRRTPITGSILMCILFALWGCDREPGILVNIETWPEGVERVRLRTTVGETRGTDIFLDKTLTRFALRVPVGSQGTVQIDAVGLDVMGCKLATGSLTELVPDNLSRFVERTLVLSSLSFPICPFAPAISYPVAPSLLSMAAGDLNNDLKTDLVLPSHTDGTVNVLFGTGAGTIGGLTTITFPETIPPPKDYGLHSVAIGDFNGDTKPDLAVTGYYKNVVRVLLGNGMGSFIPLADFPVGIWPTSLAVGYFNEDMILDLAVANYSSNNVSVLLGNGAGSFGMASNFRVGSQPRSIVVGDFNGDMNPDLAVANYNSNNVSVLLGNGAGNFSIASNFPAGSRPTSVAVGDFNGDNKPDLAVTSAGDITDSVVPKVTVLLGNGAGGFSSASIPLNLPASSVAVGDFNRDTKLDLAITCADGMPKNHEVRLLFGNGAGDFSLASISPVNENPTSVVVADFNDDMKPDLATANFTSQDVSVLLNQFD